MSDADKSPHTRHVVQQEPQEGFFKVEERKLIRQNQITANITLKKGVHTVSGNEQSNRTESIFMEINGFVTIFFAIPTTMLQWKPRCRLISTNPQ